MENKEQKDSKKTAGKTVSPRMIAAVIAIVIVALIIGFAAGKLFSSDKTGKSSDNKKKTSKNDMPVVLSTDYVELGEYNGVSVDLSVTEEDIQDAIEDTLSEYATYDELEGTAQVGSTVAVDYVGYMDGQEFEGGSGSDVLTIGEGDFIQDFENGIVGMNTGETKSVDCVFPEDFGDEELNGKAATFSITLKYIQGEEHIPTLDDSFVQSVSESSTTVEEYKEEVKERLYQENVDYKADFAWDVVLNNAKILSYPEELMDIAEQELIEGYQGLADMYNVSFDEALQMLGYEDEADFRENDMDEWAKEMVADYLVSEAIADAEGIVLSDEEYQEALETEYAYYTDTYSDIAAFEEVKGEMVKRDYLLKKVKEWVGDAAVIEE